MPRSTTPPARFSRRPWTSAGLAGADGDPVVPGRGVHRVEARAAVDPSAPRRRKGSPARGLHVELLLGRPDDVRVLPAADQVAATTLDRFRAAQVVSADETAS